MRQYYVPTSEHARRLAADDACGARALAAWKQKVAQAWDQVHIRRTDVAVREIASDAVLPIEVAVQLHDLTPEDVVVECLVDTESEAGECVVRYRCVLVAGEKYAQDETVFRLDLKPELAGLQYYRLRIYPCHPMLGHPFETGYMLWI